jgi:hypothetical protein
MRYVAPGGERRTVRHHVEDGDSELLAETYSRFWLTGEGWVFNVVAGDEGSIDRIDFEADGMTMSAEPIEEQAKNGQGHVDA